MIQDKKSAFDTISRVLAITRLDIEHHQAINDMSLNIHGEDYFKDVFNFVYDCDFKNANYIKLNEPYIDLVDDTKKKVIQITTTRTKEKILTSLQALLNPKYKDYDISIFYLLDKAMPTKNTVREVQSKYSINLKDILKDSKDLVKDINFLESNKLIELCTKYFLPKESKYTEQIILDLVFRKLLKEKVSTHVSYEDDLGSIEADEKIVINKINPRVANKIINSLDYTCIVDSFDDVDLSTDLRKLIVNEFYRGLLVEQLKSKVRKEELLTLDLPALQELAVHKKLDFSKLITLLSYKIESHIAIRDFNSMNISWILVSYFFEICDVGVKSFDTAE
jgi:hypothetical protein